MRIKKLFSLLISLILVFGASVINVSADEIKTDVLYKDEVPIFSFSTLSLLQEAETVATDSVNYEELRQCLFEGIYNCQEYIDVSKFGILVDDISVVIGNLLWYEMPEAFHISNEMDYSYYENSMLVFSISVAYNCTAEE